MKGLSIEQKARRYDEAIARANEMIKAMTNIGGVAKVDDIQHIFPELKELDDEKVKKAIIEFVRQNRSFNYCLGISTEEAIAWLERQGEQKEKNYNEELEKCNANPLYFFDKYVNVKLKEQNPADNVEPKFKIEKDKWYVCTSQYCNCIEGRNYKASLDGRIIDDYGTEYDMHDDAYRWFRPWTIQDAKKCDVIVTKNQNIFIFKEIKGTIVYDYCGLYFDKFWATPNNVNGKLDTELPKDYVPATKEQCNLLFQKMKEAGYEWDAEKKELKKIENEIEIPFGAKDSELQEETYFIPKGFHAEIDDDKVVIKKGEKPTAWSEEDEHRIKDTIYFLDTAKKHYASTVELDACINWLKSLKQRIGGEL